MRTLHSRHRAPASWRREVLGRFEFSVAWSEEKHPGTIWVRITGFDGRMFAIKIESFGRDDEFSIDRAHLTKAIEMTLSAERDPTPHETIARRRLRRR